MKTVRNITVTEKQKQKKLKFTNFLKKFNLKKLIKIQKSATQCEIFDTSGEMD